MEVTYHLLDAAGTLAVHDEIRRTYAQTWGLEPEDGRAMDFGTDTLPRHASRPWFRCCVARQGDGGPMLGFAYGYAGAPGMWWYDQVAPALDPESRGRWLSSYFEFTELALVPEARGQGVGGRLHDLLLQGLYQKRGWVTILAPFRFGNRSEPYRIMALDLQGGT